jgi:phage terminase small subunit
MPTASRKSAVAKPAPSSKRRGSTPVASQKVARRPSPQTVKPKTNGALGKTPEDDDFLGPKMELFCQEYVVDFNGTRAAIAAGYKADYAGEQASQYLKKPEVRARLAVLKAARLAKVKLTQQEVLERLAAQVRHDPRLLFNEDGSLKSPHELDDETAMGIVAIEHTAVRDMETGKVIGHTAKVKSTDRVASIALAMRHFGMLKDKLDLNISPVQVHDMAALARLTDAELEQLERLNAKLASFKLEAEGGKEA